MTLINQYQEKMTNDFAKTIKIVDELHKLNLMIREQCGLTLNQVQLLHRINTSDRVILKDLAKQIGVTGPAISRQLGVLIEKNYVSQSNVNVDRRQRSLTITPECQAELNALQPYINQSLDNIAVIMDD